MGYSEWKLVELKDILDINPRITLKKGETSKKIAMEHLKEYTRKVQGYTHAHFKGGSKFQNGDTLMARITPCLENGKTAYVDILEENETAFGSTEFFVLRGKEDQADSKFIYYLSVLDEIRNVTIQSMTGTSGRQRAQKEALLTYNMKIPSLVEQKQIVKVLSSLDDKIELNNQIINNLEQLAQTLFKRWFVGFEFPNENGEPYRSSGGKMVESELGMIPEGWEVRMLEEIANHSKKSFNPKKTKLEEVAHFSLPAFDSRKYPVIDKTDEIKSNKYFIDEYSIMFSKMNPNTPRVWMPNILKDHESVCSSEFVVLGSKDLYQRSFVYELCKSEKYFEFLVSNASGSTNSRQRIKPSAAISYKVSLDSQVVNEFGKKIKGSHELILSLREQNNRLISLRDTLLPKLLSGELELPSESEVADDVPIS